MLESFEKLGLIAPLVEGLQKAGITVPTGIQEQVIPFALQGKDVAGQSATGTGKTLTYLLPIFQKIDTTKREVQAIILAPTYELAIQIERQIEMLVKNSGMAVTSTPLIGNVNITRQIDKLKEKPHIVVGSSGRILELIQKKKISAPTVKTIVLDEADRLLDDQNLDSVKAVIKSTLKDRQIMLFSATLPAATLAKASSFMRDPEIVTVKGQTSVAPDISHMYFVTEHRDKIEVLRKLVGMLKMERALVFVNRTDDIEITASKLKHHGLKAAALCGSTAKIDRKKSMEDFRSGKIELLVASDVAARGLDISGVDYVLNLDMPEDPTLYLHRVGRTGRAGEVGTAIPLLLLRKLALSSTTRKY